MNPLDQLLTSSSGILAPHNANNPLFFPLTISSTTYFDDGPVVFSRLPTDISSGSLGNLSSSYPYLQGVEITRQAQYDAGLFKVWSGDPQHQLLPCVFGQNQVVFPGQAFIDQPSFSPLEFIASQASGSRAADNDVLQVIVAAGAQVNSRDGSLEPLTVRLTPSGSLMMHDHRAWGQYSGGNVDSLGGSEQILTVDYYDVHQVILPFDDTSVNLRVVPLNLDAPVYLTLKGIDPFVDQRLSRDVPAPSSEPADLLAALGQLTGSTDNYVRYDQRSSTCGWYYDNDTSVGTDSLAFGGMAY